ncbi:DeoR/GlpR family DNA-binding transcription regulator [Dictyobacter arantiisoli]|uniref:Lactose phosphotransferase system repressor n=1 Tax=Dictyobacter arantiisoli TaxID=2014874 RepID=A0A5A5TJP5_9CHLR|nr:DeoR/GlpR family DNA-binding transcription regulator [Dictyobacter arantiisoli]GCF11458.1 DeoR family transcriptional regulator [Dictyobacter arantiisoli]
MLKEERQYYIIEQLRQQGKVVAVDLVAQLKVSEDTIRRDLTELAEAGILQRVHGGALPRLKTVSYEQRQQDEQSTRIEIARAAAQLIRDGQVILMDSGTTVHEIANQLPPTLHATIITNSLPVAATLIHHPTVTVQVLGGQLKKDAQAMVGVSVIEALRQIRADLCFLGICSIHPDIGISMPEIEESYIKRAMLEQAAEVAAVTGAAKLGTAAPYIVGPIHALTYLVTDNSLAPEALAPYQQQGLQIVRASSEEVSPAIFIHSSALYPSG